MDLSMAGHPLPEISDGISIVKMVLPPMSQETVILMWLERDPECARMKCLLAIKPRSLAGEAGDLPGYPTLLGSIQGSGSH